MISQEKNSARITDYGVNRKALKAVCTPRISKLSVPRNPKRGINSEEKTVFSRGDAVRSPELLAEREKILKLNCRKIRTEFCDSKSELKSRKHTR